MGYFQILSSCSSDLGNCCTNPAIIVILENLRRIFNLVQLIVPILLIVFATIKFSQLAMDPDRKNGLKEVKNSFLAAAIVFFIPVFMDAVLTIIPNTFSVSACWDNAKVSAETYRSYNFKYSPYDDAYKNKTTAKIIQNGDGYEPSEPGSDSSGSGVNAASAKGILEGAEKVHTMYEKNGWAYYTSLGQLRWNDIEYSTNNPSKMTCCATFVGSALYVGGVFSASELNKSQYNYNSQLGIDTLCKEHGWTKITSYGSLAAGDIVIMSGPGGGSTPGHVQIYAGNGTWYNAGSTNAIQRENPYASDASGRFLWAWRKP